jgi:hypothetical protein
MNVYHQSLPTAPLATPPPLLVYCGYRYRTRIRAGMVDERTSMSTKLSIAGITEPASIQG